MGQMNKGSEFWRNVSSFSPSSLQTSLRAGLLFSLYAPPAYSLSHTQSQLMDTQSMLSKSGGLVGGKVNRSLVTPNPSGPGVLLCPLTSKGDFSAQIALWYQHQLNQKT